MLHLAYGIRQISVESRAESAVEPGNGARWNCVQNAALQREDKHHFFGEPKRRVLGLLEDSANARVNRSLTRASGMPPKRVNISSARNCA